MWCFYFLLDDGLSLPETGAGVKALPLGLRRGVVRCSLLNRTRVGGRLAA